MRGGSFCASLLFPISGHQVRKESWLVPLSVSWAYPLVPPPLLQAGVTATASSLISLAQFPLFQYILPTSARFSFFNNIFILLKTSRGLLFRTRMSKLLWEAVEAPVPPPSHRTPDPVPSAVGLTVLSSSLSPPGPPAHFAGSSGILSYSMSIPPSSQASPLGQGCRILTLSFYILSYG